MTSPVRVLCIGDPHIKADNFNEISLMISSIREILLKEDIDFICVMGDTLHTFEIINANCLCLATEFFRMLKNHAKHLYIIVGNHEIKNNNEFLTKKHPYNSFKDWEKTTVVDDVIEDTYKGQKFIFSPFVPDGRFFEALGTKNIFPPFSSYTAVFGHSDFSGSSISKLSNAKLDTWPEDAPVAIMGHLHDYEEVGKNIIFVGTPIQHANHDKGEKTVSLFSFFSRDNFRQERIDLHIPKRLLVKLTVDELENFVIPENCSFITIKVEGLSKDIINVMKLKKVKDLEMMKDKVKIIKILTDSKIKVSLKDMSFVKKRKPLKDRIHDAISLSTPETMKTFSSLFFQIKKEDKKEESRKEAEKEENRKEDKKEENRKEAENKKEENRKETVNEKEKGGKKSRLKIV